MSVENYIKQNVKGICSKVYIAPEIPEKKLNNAISSIAKGENPDYVLAILDTSLFGNGKDGCVFFGDKFFVREMLNTPVEYDFSLIKEAEYMYEEVKKKDDKIEKVEKVVIHYNDENKKFLYLTGLKHKQLAELINGIIAEAGEEKNFISTSQLLPLAAMADDIKNAYIKIVCNFAYTDKERIGSKEYAEITSLIVRINYDSEKRLELRQYMSNNSNTEDTMSLIRYLNTNVSEGSLDVIKKSLIKDIMYIYKTSNNVSNWKENKFITLLQERFQVNEEQIDLIIEAIRTDEEILSLRKNDSEIKKSIKDLAAKAGAVGVPLAALYFSGSVVGMSAAGITSGLATLGMGGILGLSGMVTGIGVVVLLGVGTYKGIKKFTGISDLENNKQREMMLQGIIKNAQKSLDYLVEDVNEISRRLRDTILINFESKQEIEELLESLDMMSEGAKITSEKINYAESETIISHLPKILDVVRLRELTTEPTKEKFYDYIIAHYEEKVVINEDGEQKVINLVLNNAFSLNELEELYLIFQEIGYTNMKEAAVASAKGIAKNLVKSVVK